ncbi:hypothetical protein ADICYQ_3944 [Cyclobacterium qasimii M12-11B]|uniref:Uncharacterized protein n=1 Tax=Cyclobacterium qasimii M12-11B TaxID=641524 RepID=S7WK30_9BACT|nr:hypothetical protein ADICYQ_3944 [Cyclobacterium qasimii M12-11B]
MCKHETDKTNTQNIIYPCQHRLFGLRALDFGKGLDIAITGYSAGTSK